MVGKIKSLTFCLLFFISASFAADWNGSTREPENTKMIVGEIFYVITSAEELAWFAVQVNSGKSKINAVLANDIKFMDDTSKTSSVNWVPIGMDSTMMFDGDFDGAGKTIYGLHCDREFAGIFGVTNKYAVIKNVKLAKSSIIGNFGRVGVGEDLRYVGFTGGIVAINKGALYGCANSGAVTYSYSDSAVKISVFVGGIVGENRGSIDNCTNSGTITGTGSVGGIVGRNVGNSAVVKSCVNEGTVTSTGDYVGGIVGRNVGDTAVVKSCVNEGAVTSVGDYVGGIVGETRGSINNCTNSGTITGTGSVGGIVGINWADVKRCMNEGSVIGISGKVGGIAGGNCFGEIVGCLNSGFVSSTSHYSGGIAGSNSGTISVCTNYGLVEGNKSAGIVGYNSDGGNFVGKAKVTDCRNLILISKSRASAGLVYKNTFSTIRNSFSVADEGSGIDVNDRGIVSNCYFDSAVYMYSVVGIIPCAAMSTSDMQSDRFAWILNTTNGEALNSEIWSRDSVGYPIFADSLHRPIYKVVFDNGRDSMDCFTNYKGLVPFPDNPEQPSKLFRGWFTEDGDKIDNLTVFSKDQTVYAAYTDLYFSIRFFDSDSSLLDSQYVKYGDMPSEVGDSTKDSTAQYIYNFKGWYVYPVTRDFANSTCQCNRMLNLCKIYSFGVM